MQITLNVDGSLLDQEVKDLLSNLSEEQKRTLALEVLSKSLDNTGSELLLMQARERVQKDYNAKVAHPSDQILWRDGSWRRAGYNNDYTNHPSYEDRERLNKAVSEKSSTATFFKENVLKQMVTTAEEEVKNLIKTSPEIQKALDTAKKTIEDNLPKMVHDAMLMYFCTQMESMSHSIASAMFQGGQNQQLLQEIQKQFQ